jgi:hypothetical protein
MIRTTMLALAVFLGTIGVAFVGAQAKPAGLADTPQGKVVLAFYKAAHAGDVAAVKKLVTEASAKEVDGMPGFADMLKAMAPVATPTIASVNVTGNTAKVDATYKTASTSSTDHWSLAKVGTVWLMDMAKK